MDYVINVPKFRIGSRRVDFFPIWIGLLVLGLAIGGVGAYQVLRYGLSVTGLSNQVPWGLWIVIDLSSIALGGGAFAMGLVVFLFKIKRFENIGKLGVLIGFLGYSTAGLTIFFDLGQPFRIWHPLVFWQVHSLLWEITMCVVFYLIVLVLELYPTIVAYPLFDRFPILSQIVHVIHRFSPYLAVAGLSLSLLHQASLGATYGVLSGRGLWFNPSAPVMFVLSAVGGGLALLFVLSVLVFRVMRPGIVEDSALVGLAHMAGAVLLLYGYLRCWDWAVTYYYSFDIQVATQVELLNKVAPYSISFWLGQILFGAVIPGFVLITYRERGNLRLRIVVGLLAALGVVLTRWDYNFAGVIASITYDPFTPTVKLNSYIPTWQEFAIATGLISFWLLGFSLAARFLPFSNQHAGDRHTPA
jgi:Ni/Fe-hydrogenase subunit HybB-like protein